MVLCQITQFESQTTYAEGSLCPKTFFNNEFLYLFVQEIIARNYAPRYKSCYKDY